MKGPSGKSMYRVQRRWKCARCGKELVTAGNIVSQPCPGCPPAKDGTPAWMSIVEPKRKRNPFPFGTSHVEG